MVATGGRMQVETTRFGSVEVDDSRLLQFPAGLLGFGRVHQFALLQPDDRGVFFWLQSIESPDVAFCGHGSTALVRRLHGLHAP